MLYCVGPQYLHRSFYTSIGSRVLGWWHHLAQELPLPFSPSFLCRRLCSCKATNALNLASSHPLLLILDMNIYLSYMSCPNRRTLQIQSNPNFLPAEEIPPSLSESLELVLLRRWENLTKELKASGGTRPTYSRRQMHYIWRLATELMSLKSRFILVCNILKSFGNNSNKWRFVYLHL